MENLGKNIYYSLCKVCKIALLPLLFSVATIVVNAQTPGDWTPSGGGTSTTTPDAVGVGTTLPVGWQEIQYCDDDENGLVITKNSCPLSPNETYPLTFDGMLEPVFNDGEGNPSGIPYPTPDFTLRQFGSLGNTSPMLWARVENNPSFNGLTSGTYSSRFIVTPTGKVGVNIEMPRATFDVKSIGGYNYPGLIIGRQKLGSPSKTRHTMFIPLLEENGYSPISKKSDQGIFFTDGNGPEGENQNGSFVIAPWVESTNTTAGGLRIDEEGNLEVHGTTRATKLKVEAKWWSDFVFADDYELMSLSKLEKFIDSNKHLPNVPCEEEVMEEGLDVAEMQAIQQQKIEELTLYIIELEKKMKLLEQKLDIISD